MFTLFLHFSLCHIRCFIFLHYAADAAIIYVYVISLFDYWPITMFSPAAAFLSLFDAIAAATRFASLPPFHDDAGCRHISLPPL